MNRRVPIKAIRAMSTTSPVVMNRRDAFGGPLGFSFIMLPLLVRADGKGLAKRLQPAMMILWTNDPLIKREMAQQVRTSLRPVGSPELVRCCG
jgi:hypothetical protein